VKPILITCGDPAGVGPEVALKALAGGAAGRPILLVGEAAVWLAAAELTGIPVRCVRDTTEADHRAPWPVWATEKQDRGLLSSAAAERWKAGDDPTDRADRDLAGRGAVLNEALRRAVRVCLDGRAAAVVTMPIDKRALRAAGVEFPGHTEYLAHLCGVRRPVMLLFGPDLRVVPLTRHVPYAAVPELLTFDLILEAIRLTNDGVRRYFGLAQPRLALCGLNPHAGEGGLLGTEEIRVLEPAARSARDEGIAVVGPLPADSAFATRDRYDALLCPTHDQALIPLKQLSFDRGVNATLGLPIIRTSPDHGTARDIAWQNRANEASAAAAVRAAVEWTQRAGGDER